jgi:amidohydrolase
MQKSKGTEPIRALAFLSHLLPAGADAVVAASSIVLNLQTMVSREFEPMDPLVVTIGSFNSGSRFNIIAGTAELTGTCRSFNQEIYESLPTVMERIVKGTAEALKCTADVEFSRLTKPLTNDDKAYDIMKGTGAKVIPEQLRFEGRLSTLGEDFAEYMACVPGMFVQLDAGGKYPLHSCHVQFDESAFENGIAIEVQFSLDAMKRPGQEKNA